MISKLALINKKRNNKDLFTYRIGVGLCYGTMFSGTVGSFDTRLDYSILGEPLKKAAKLEALTINNPSFPLVVCNKIADKIACLGIVLKAIESKNQDFPVYSLDLNKNKDVAKTLGLVAEEDNNKQEILFNSNKQPENIVDFSLQSSPENIIRKNNNLLIICNS